MNPWETFWYKLLIVGIAAMYRVNKDDSLNFDSNDITMAQTYVDDGLSALS